MDLMSVNDSRDHGSRQSPGSLVQILFPTRPISDSGAAHVDDHCKANQPLKSISCHRRQLSRARAATIRELGLQKCALKRQLQFCGCKDGGRFCFLIASRILSVNFTARPFKGCAPFSMTIVCLDDVRSVAMDNDRR